jgi:hypothetical protein
MEIDYSEPEMVQIPQNILDLLLVKDPYLDTTEAQIINVESPFIIANNYFDLRESNNDMILIGVNCVKTVTFTGGSFYTIYEKDESSEVSCIFQGNEIEGYNLFMLI